MSEDLVTRDGPLTRVGHAERHAAVQTLTSHWAAGHIAASEFEERLDRIDGARTVADLSGVFSDLPSGSTFIPASSPVVPTSGLGRRLPVSQRRLAACLGGLTVTASASWLLNFNWFLLPG